MRRALLIAIPVMLLVGAAFYFLLWAPIGEDIAVQEQELSTLQAQENALRQRLTELNRINERLPEYDRANANMLLSIPQLPQIDGLTDELSVLADRANVVWDAVSFSTPGEQSNTGVREVALAMTVTGQYFEVLGYMYGLAELDRLIRVDGITVAPAIDAETGVNTLTVTINAVAFTTGAIVVPPPPEVAEPDIPVETTTTTTTVPASTTTTTVGG
ncbi:MAG: type 4a pilus biogenesis protein PilO [Acidimicrobiia bacterium]|nr:type 4a pilus biogenesis protein PilO [Acidimicrobiia bacterium]